MPSKKEEAAFLRLPDSVQKVEFDEKGESSLTLEGLQDNSVFLVKVNLTETIVPAAGTVPLQSAAGETLAPVVGAEGRIPAGTITLGGKTLTRYERRWGITPLPERNILRANRSVLRSFTAPVENGTKDFYVNIPDGKDNPYTLKSATLKKNGQYCRVWVVNENLADGVSTSNDNKITEAQIGALAAKFDAIYPLETNLLGYEYGGGPGGNGGADGDTKIQILLYDIDGDFENKTKTGLTLGYFNPADEFEQGEDVPYSNEAEIFYLDSEVLDAAPEAIYSTLIHEFNHMINFNVKVLDGDYASSWNETWYTEMLSMLAEDAIGPLAGIDYVPGERNGNVIMERIHPLWLVYYYFSVMRWPSDPQNALSAYASNYAFGAYLVRNFGGPELLSRIAKSKTGGKASLDAALKALNKTVDGAPVDHIYALSRFGEALVYAGPLMPKDALSFYKTAAGTVGGVTYTFPRFNIWQMDYSMNDQQKAGPLVYSYSANDLLMNAYSVQLYSEKEWLGIKGGSLTVNLSGGAPGIVHYVMVKGPF